MPGVKMRPYLLGDHYSIHSRENGTERVQWNRVQEPQSPVVSLQASACSINLAKAGADAVPEKWCFKERRKPRQEPEKGFKVCIQNKHQIYLFI